MATYKSPGVYVKEISVFPPSVAQVETAIPAFIGYTEKATKSGKSIINIPTRITSILQFAMYFGGPPDPVTINVTLNDDNSVNNVTIVPQFYLYNCIRMFYANGGGPCYIVSVGSYSDTVALGNPIPSEFAAGLLVGLQALEKYDEPTLIVSPDAVRLSNAVELGSIQQAALRQCNKLQDRFCIFDVFKGDQEKSYDNSDVITLFRNGVGMQYLKYCAAYYPWIETNLPYKVDYSNVDIFKGDSETKVTLASISQDPASANELDNALANEQAVTGFIQTPDFGGGKSIKEAYAGIDVTDDKPEMQKRAKSLHELLTGFIGLSFTNAEYVKGFNTLKNVTSGDNPEPLFKQFANKLKSYDAGYPTDGPLCEVDDGDYPAEYGMGAVIAENIYGDGDDASKAANGRDKFQELFESIMSSIEKFGVEGKEIIKMAEETVKSTNVVYKNILDEIKKEALTLPPSGAVAGIYCAVDADRGVWKAPANVSLSNTIRPAVLVTAEDQENLNVDVNVGKSVNAIRSFSGKGTLIWGARTLAGNDNEWRYISVRRFFNMVEESVKKSTMWAVFEPNDANTWIRVKSMIENYLTQLWRDGALFGSTTDEAFFVKIGLGITMTAQDILEGRMNVEIGMAAVRPAEFIILKFSHKMPES